METTLTRKKLIDIPENVFRNLSIKAAANGTNLKKYIENLLAKDATDIDDNKIYAYLSNTIPEGHKTANEQEKKEFENWLGIESK